MADVQGIKVFLNGTPVELPRELTFDELTRRAFPDVQRTDSIDWEVDYGDPQEPRSGSTELKPGQTLVVTRGMVIDVSYTDKS